VAGADHVPHVLPLSVYIGVWVALIVFTAITVGVSYVDIGRTGNLLVAVGVATMKALMVAAIFMHLAFDKKFNSIIFASSLIFLAIFVGFTMFDTNARGMTDRGSADKPATVDTPFESTRGREAIRARYKDSSKLPPPPLPGRESELSPVVPPPSDSAPAVDEANHGAPAAGSKDGEHQQPGH
jgi:cytochrome c oxidase subunit 4